MSKHDNTSPIYHVRHWRAVPVEEEDALEAFLTWLEFDDQASDYDNDVERIKAIVDAYLGRKMDKVTQGERELLEGWIKATKEIKP